MNAYELADDVKNISNTIEALEWVQKASPLLRQQADRIAELEKKCKWYDDTYRLPTDQQNAEPVAWMVIDVDNGKSLQFKENKFSEINIPLYTAPREFSDGCGNCHACLVGVMENNMPVTSQRMIVCSDCGNKRCPKASNHRHKCTGSNEVGQYGSIYTAPRELSDEEIDLKWWISSFEHLKALGGGISDEMETKLKDMKERLKKASEK